MKLVIFIVSFGILTRVIPHIPNFSPEIVFALYLGMKNTGLRASAYILSMALISDLLLGFGIGSWAIFTYSAFLAIGGIGIYIKNKGFGVSFVLSAASVTLAYWAWTNFGAWLLSPLYPHTLAGFVTCYTLALPFLSNALAASLAWCAIITLCETYLPRKRLYETT